MKEKFDKDLYIVDNYDSMLFRVVDTIAMFNSDVKDFLNKQYGGETSDCSKGFRSDRFIDIVLDDYNSTETDFKIYNMDSYIDSEGFYEDYERTVIYKGIRDCFSECFKLFLSLGLSKENIDLLMSNVIETSNMIRKAYEEIS